jgi:hypothetical protein
MRAFGRITPRVDPLTIDVEFARNDFACEVRGSVVFEPSNEPADAQRVARLTRAWLVMGVRDAQRAAGNSRAALPTARAVETMMRDELGDGHMLTQMAIAKIASLYWDIGDYAASRPLAEAAVTGLTAALGADHPNVLQQVNNLALVLWNQGDLAGTETRLRHIVDRYEALLGPDDGNRLGTLTNLATLLAQRGRYVEAEAIQRDVLLRRERVFGPTHPATIVSINNLATMYAASGWLDEAAVQANLAYERYLASLGARHPATLRSRTSLASFAARRGDSATATSELREILALRREVIGPRHTETLLTQERLAVVLAEQGKLDEALPLVREAASLRASTSGAENITTLHAEALLGRLESQAGDHAAAVPRLRRAREGALNKVGAYDPATVEIAAQLGYAQHAAGDRAGARATLTDVVAVVERWRETGGFTAARRAVLFAPWVRAYKELAFVALGQDEIASAFDQAERSKARVLVESLALRRGETTAILPREALDALALLDARVTALETEQLGATDPAHRLAVGQALAAAVADAAAQRAALRERYPRYAALAQARLVTAQEGAAELAAGTVFVSYLVQGDRVLAFALTRDGRLRGYDRGTLAGLDALVTPNRTQLSAQDQAPPVGKTADGR